MRKYIIVFLLLLASNAYAWDLTTCPNVTWIAPRDCGGNGGILVGGIYTPCRVYCSYYGATLDTQQVKCACIDDMPNN